MNGALKKLFGEIPSEWKIRKLADATEVIVDGTHFTPKYTKVGIPFLRVTDLKNKIIDLEDVKYISKREHLELIKRCKPQIGDILLSKNGTIGITKIIDWHWEFSIFVSLAIIRTKQDLLNNGFLKFFFNSAYLEKQIQLQVKQGTVTNLHLEEIRKFMIPLPPLFEQKKIASILKSIDDKLENITAQINEYTNLKKGLMQKLLVKGIGHTKFKDSPLGQIPEEWELVKLGDILSVKHGFAFQGEKFTKIPNENLLLTPVNFSIDGGIKFVWEKQKFYSGEFPKEYILYEGDLIVAMTDLTQDCNILGSPAIIPDSNFKYLHNQRLGLVNIFDIAKVDKLFLFYIFNDRHYREFLRNTKTGSTVSHTSPKTIYEVNITLPGISEQQKIATILSSVDTKIESLQTKNEEYTQLKKGLMEKLLTGKIRVKV